MDSLGSVSLAKMKTHHSFRNHLPYKYEVLIHTSSKNSGFLALENFILKACDPIYSIDYFIGVRRHTTLVIEEMFLESWCASIQVAIKAIGGE